MDLVLTVDTMWFALFSLALDCANIWIFILCIVDMFCVTSEISLLYLTLKQGIQCRLCSSCRLLEAYTR